MMRMALISSQDFMTTSSQIVTEISCSESVVAISAFRSVEAVSHLPSLVYGLN